jgi:hypothetical protein
MSCALLLPNTHEQLPQGLCPAALEKIETGCHEVLQSFTPEPTWLLGSEQTPALDWLLAIQAFPQAGRLCYRAGSGWWDLASNQLWTPPTPASEPLPVAASIQPASGESKPSPTAEAAPTVHEKSSSPHSNVPRASLPLSQWTDDDLIEWSFLYAAWGYDQYRRFLQEYEEEALKRSTTLVKAVREAREYGQRAAELDTELMQRLKQGEAEAVLTEWIATVCQGLYWRVPRHLKSSLKKGLKGKRTRQERFDDNRTHECTLEPVELVDGLHPNSLRHLAPATDWSVYIDESGLLFDGHAVTPDVKPSEVGRLVALAVPAGAALDPMPDGFHASAAVSSAVDAVLQRMLRAPVGIFGYCVQDPSSNAQRWIGHVEQLVRWVLLQLPVPQGQACRVKVYIEQKGTFFVGHNLAALAEILESECVRLAPERFAGLHLSLEFMDKTHPFNGYVDAVAFTWGSPTKISRERLKRSALEFRCLINPRQRALERLYLALNTQRKLLPGDWFELCSAAAAEPGEGLLRHFLEQLGEQVRLQDGLWQGYLDEVRQRLRLKRFHLDSLGHALDWLERWAPQGQSLPAAQCLMLETARLAATNHRGLVDLARIERCLALMNALRDEAPAEACEALLRIAVSCANNFEFDALRPAVEAWLAEPVAVPGLLNRAKLHSTLGQLEAFCARPSSAIDHFDKALIYFGRLSDPQQAQRESQQTLTYRLIAEMDAADLDLPGLADAWVAHMRGLTGLSDAAQISRSLATSTQDLRYTHHLWLRALVNWPHALDAARQEYLAQAKQWNSQEDHPWPLIEAYRGWLLADADRPAEARRHFMAAIERCAAPDNGPTLHWMAEVLRTMATALGLHLHDQPSAHARDRLRKVLPLAPHAALERFAQAGTLRHGALLHALRNCLPFNFH